MSPLKNKPRFAVWSKFVGGSDSGNWADRNYRTIVTAFFLLFLLLAISIVRDFGISYDEPTNRLNGFVSFAYVVKLIRPQYYKIHFGGVPDLYHYIDRDYGVFFELPVVVIESALRMTVESHIAYLHHFLTFMVFFAAVIFFYRISSRRFNSWKMGLLGCTMLIISPRIFAQSFYNSKDLVFMSFFLIATYTLLRFLRRRNWQSALLHAFACTAAIDTRIMGILIPIVTFGIIAAEIIKAPNIKQACIKWAKLLAVYVMALVIMVIACWPYLWASPVHNFITAFNNMSDFRWHLNSLFMGRYITPSKYIPWYYIPVWIVISTPVLYTVLFLTGSFIALKAIIKQRFKIYSNEQGRSDLIFLVLFFGPLLAVIVLKSVLYDAWRQMYFIYPAFLLLALVGFVKIYRGSKKTWLKYGLVTATLLSFGFTAAFMIRNHPFEDVYFSCLPDKVAAKNFELDYWGLSFRKGLEYIVSHDSSKSIVVGYSPFATQNRLMLKPADERRVRVQDSTETSPGWIISNYRWKTKPHYNYHDESKEVYSIYVGHIKILSVFKLK